RPLRSTLFPYTTLFRSQTDKVVAVGLYGKQLSIGYASRSGWNATGVEWLITRSDDKTLYELNGKPALQLYKDYLGDMASGLPGADRKSTRLNSSHVATS